MGFLERFLPEQDRFAALMLYGMVFATCFNGISILLMQNLLLHCPGYDAGIMTVILADEQFIKYYSVDAQKTGVIATIPWATTGMFGNEIGHQRGSTDSLRLGLAQLFIGGTLASYVGRLWALRASIVFMCLGV